MSITRAAFFALGAALGGGAVAALHASKKKDAPSSTGQTPNLPVVEMGVTGDPRFSAGAATAVGPVLKYGNPGTSPTFGSCQAKIIICRPYFGPTCASGVCGRL